ncbi:MAG: hypothetical protein E6G67_09675 [Actinobacteria bacterium]|nr:MAG: hypothetical protein E6G67_09675 [Actinomycetota bacterium]
MSEIGLFPLDLVLLPGEQRPLHVFEPRYKELIGECLDEETEFGLVLADEEGMREVGTRAAVVEVLERFDDGRLNVVIEGGDDRGGRRHRRRRRGSDGRRARPLPACVRAGRRRGRRRSHRARPGGREPGLSDRRAHRPRDDRQAGSARAPLRATARDSPRPASRPRSRGCSPGTVGPRAGRLERTGRAPLNRPGAAKGRHRSRRREVDSLRSAHARPSRVG